MTLPRTIKRREQRKRAKARKAQGHLVRSFGYPDWVGLESLKLLGNQFPPMGVRILND